MLTYMLIALATIQSDPSGWTTTIKDVKRIEVGEFNSMDDCQKAIPTTPQNPRLNGVNYFCVQKDQPNSRSE